MRYISCKLDHEFFQLFLQEDVRLEDYFFIEVIYLLFELIYYLPWSLLVILLHIKYAK